MLQRTLLQDLLQLALSTGADFAEIYCEETRRSQLSMINGNLEKASSGLDAGIGVRMLKGPQCLYSITNDWTEGALVSLVRDAAAALRDAGRSGLPPLQATVGRCSHPVLIYPHHMAKPVKVSLLRLASDSAYAYSPLISQTRCGMIEWESTIQIANSEGLLADDERVYSRFTVEAVAASATEKQTGAHLPGARRGYEFFEQLPVETLAADAARMAVTMLQAEPCPSGQMPVVIDSGFGGVIFHESCGHGLEATALARRASVFQGKLGQPIASPLVTAVDDATLAHEWGSQDIDDEGTPTRRIVLIENGILRSYLVDRHNGSKLGLASTGSSRRESYRYAPTSRMSNTFIAPGQDTPEAIIKATPNGLYARHMGGGSVDPASGDFNFSVREAYLIRDGQIAQPVRGATLIGKGADVLHRIDRVGSNLELAQGMCGSSSGSVPANVGQPMIRVSNLTVGGRGQA